VNAPKRISLIIPAYNEERYLGACLDEVARQTVMPDEVIVVDNNSTDATAAIAQRYPFVTLLQESAQGIVYARNRGFEAASGDILARTDADVVLPETWVERVGDFYADPKHAEWGLSGNGRPNNLPFSRILGWLQGQIAFRTNRWLLGHYIFFGSNMALPRSGWQQVRAAVCLRTDIHEDLDLAIHFHRAGGTISYQETLQVVGRAARVTTDRDQLLDNLMLWPRTLRAHHIPTWVFGWLGAVLLYGLSPLPWLAAKLASLFKR
jgi:glycosyltransferase involved in cell wall biosynthesis